MTSSIFSSSKNLILHSSVKHREGTYNTSYIDVRTCPFLPSAFASVFWNHSLVLQPSSSLTPVLLFLCSNSSLHPLRNPLPVGICRPGHVPLTMWSHHGMDSGGRPSSLSLWSLKCGLLFFFSCSTPWPANGAYLRAYTHTSQCWLHHLLPLTPLKSCFTSLGLNFLIC